jgi:hypothetical protein
MLRINMLAALFFASVCHSQTHPYSNAWSYYTSAETGAGEFTATTVAGTGGTATHTMDQIAVYIQSPSNRTASAYNYPSGTSGQATAYLSLCGSTCEDGNFFVSTTGTSEYCGATSQTLALAFQSGNQNVTPYIAWIQSNPVVWNPNQVAKTANSSSVFTANLRKSQGCTAASVPILLTTLASPTIAHTLSETGVVNVTFSGAYAVKTYTLTMGQNNSSGGTISGDAGIESGVACRVSGGETRSANLTVTN